MMTKRKNKSKCFAIGFPIVTKGRATEPGYVRYIRSEENLDVSSFQNSGTHKVLSKLQSAIKVDLLSFFKGSEAKKLMGANFEGHSDALAAYTLANSFDNFELDRNTKKIPILLITGDIEFKFDQKLIGNFAGTTFPNILKTKILSSSAYYRKEQVLAKQHLIDKVSASLRAAAQFDGAILAIPRKDLDLIQEEDDFRQLKNITVCSSASAANKLVRKRKLIILPVRSGFFSIGKLFGLAGTRTKPLSIFAALAFAGLTLLGCFAWHKSLPTECLDDDFWISPKSAFSCFRLGVPPPDASKFRVLIIEHSDSAKFRNRLQESYNDYKNKYVDYVMRQASVLDNTLENQLIFIKQDRVQFESIKIKSNNDKYDLETIGSLISNFSPALILIGDVKEYGHKTINQLEYATPSRWFIYSLAGETVKYMPLTWTRRPRFRYTRRHKGESELQFLLSNYAQNAPHPFALPRFTFKGRELEQPKLILDKSNVSERSEDWLDLILFHQIGQTLSFTLTRGGLSDDTLVDSSTYFYKFLRKNHPLRDDFLLEERLIPYRMGVSSSHVVPLHNIYENTKKYITLHDWKGFDKYRKEINKNTHLQKFSSQFWSRFGISDQNDWEPAFADVFSKASVMEFFSLTLRSIVNKNINKIINSLDYSQSIVVLQFYMELAYLMGDAQLFLNLTSRVAELNDEFEIEGLENIQSFFIHNLGVAVRLEAATCRLALCSSEYKKLGSRLKFNRKWLYQDKSPNSIALLVERNLYADFLEKAPNSELVKIEELYRSIEISQFRSYHLLDGIQAMYTMLNNVDSGCDALRKISNSEQFRHSAHNYILINLLHRLHGQDPIPGSINSVMIRILKSVLEFMDVEPDIFISQLADEWVRHTNGLRNSQGIIIGTDVFSSWSVGRNCAE